MTLRLAIGTLADWRSAALTDTAGERVDNESAARDWQRRVASVLAATGIALPAMTAQTDTPSVELGWGPYGCLVLWAAYAEQPQLARPALEPLEWHKDPALARSLAAGFRSQFPSLVRGVEMWLPVAGDAIFELPAPTGDDVPAAGLATLTAELDALNAGTWRAATAEALAWRDSVDRESTRLEDLAQRGFALLRGLAGHAAQARLALWLQY